MEVVLYRKSIGTHVLVGGSTQNTVLEQSLRKYGAIMDRFGQKIAPMFMIVT